MQDWSIYHLDRQNYGNRLHGRSLHVRLTYPTSM